MPRTILRNKPLVEAIFELQWELETRGEGFQVDPHIKLLIGRMYDRLEDDYPFHEPLPLATMPDEIAPHIVRHRFRKGENQWPLVQLGPGVVTLNDTEGYVWEEFEQRISRLVDTLFELYPSPDGLSVNLVRLRYIDAIDFDFGKDSVFGFLGDMLKLHVELLPSLFEGTGISDTPLRLDLRFAFASIKPRGAMTLRFARGERKGREALLWETTVVSSGEDAPKTRNAIAECASQAHALTHNWFFQLIEGKLLERFEPCTIDQ